MSGDHRYTPGRLVLSVTRLWLPLVIAVAGAVAIVLGHGRTSLAGAGVGLLVIAVIVWMINWMIRLSVESNDDRDREEAAREYFDRHGHWPDEDET
jgi:prepilin signal peptidase PulO-like enzyme (type II secretory pathway)